MKKTVWTFGLIAGGILSLMMLATIPFMHRIGFDHGLVIGYTTMVAGFSLIYFGVRSYRDNVGHGRISFGRAVAVGSLITLIGSACYSATWQVYYFGFSRDFMVKYGEFQVAKARAAGATEAQLEQQRAETKHMAELYDNPVINFGMTILEPLPVGLILTLVSAALLRRGRKSELELGFPARASS
jgi:hypothetical protein